MKYYRIEMNGRNFTNNQFDSIFDVKSRLDVCKSIFKHSTFKVVVNFLTVNPQKNEN
jgi:hypothetical protein